jgi:prepilin-type processing-associated H-X9-DG protein
MAMLIYANDWKGKFPDVGNYDHSFDGSGNTFADYEVQRMHPAARDLLVEQYGMTRKVFYCPSNFEMNTDDNWQQTANHNFAFVGYMILGGRSGLAKTLPKIQAAGIYKGWEEIVDKDEQLFADRQGQHVHYPVLVADMTRGYNNQLSPSNHVSGPDSTGYLPQGDGGANVGYVDGHAEWHSQNTMGQVVSPPQVTQPGRRQFYFNGNIRIYF